MAGYHGYSKSNNAVGAESEGRYPMTHAKRIVAEKTGVTQKTATAILRTLHRGEYHHTSKRYNCTDYFNTAAAIRIIRFARSMGLDAADTLFLATCRAHGLHEADDTDSEWKDLDAEEFRAEIEDGTWRYMIK